MLHPDLIRHRTEFARAIANKHFEISPEGIHFPDQKVLVAGQFDTWVNGKDHQVDPNVVPTEALNYLLKAGFKNSGGLGSWYIAPFTSNSTPGPTLTAATFTGTMGEFTDYDETTRVVWTLPADPTAGSFNNSASPAVFTASSDVDADDGVDIYGAAILSASAKSATSGKIGPCSLFTGSRNLKPTDKLTIQYTIAATSTA